ncbi:MAG: DNA recombination protein RmuC [Candidatus Izemoplasmatales bacterium]|jgi:DNA recombination protein RmuC
MMFLQISESWMIVLTILSGLSLVGLIILMVRPTKVDGDALGKVTMSIERKVDDLKTSTMSNLYDSMMKLTDILNKRLTEDTAKSTENITEFRLNVAKELATFQEKINENINLRMLQINEKVEDRLAKGFKDTNETFLQIAKSVEVINEAQKKIEGLSTEMISLQEILSNNQSRGFFGEFQLNQILFSIFGEIQKGLYALQYTMREQRGKRESVRADAVIFMPEPLKLIAIDSKFPFSSYSKLFGEARLSDEEQASLVKAFGNDVKKHITDIADKYIIAGTTADFALMFVPSDGILTLIHAQLQNVLEYARDKRVTIASPTTLIPLLSSFKAVVIDHRRSQYTGEIIRQLQILNKDFERFATDWTKLDGTIKTLSSQTDRVANRVQKITDHFQKIHKVEIIEDESPLIVAQSGENNDDTDS